MSGSLTGRQVALFHDRGFHFPVEVMAEEEAGAFLAAFRRYEHVLRTAGGVLGMHKHFPKIHLVATWADRLVHHERILDAVESVVGPDILAWSTGIFTRPARSEARLAWHQDVLYFGLRNVDRGAVRVWVALTPTSPENGTMRFATASHRRGVVEHRYGGGGLEEVMRGEEVVLDVDPASVVDVRLRPGQCSLHHFALAHCSGPNSTGSDRVNFTVDYVALHVEPTTPDSALLVRGSDGYGHFAQERRPAADFDDRALETFYRATAIRDRRIHAIMRAAGRGRAEEGGGARPPSRPAGVAGSDR